MKDIGLQFMPTSVPAMTKVLITGAAGFIGHHLVEAILQRTEWRITIIDRLDCSGNLNRLAEIGAAKNPRVRFVYHDLRASTNDHLAARLATQLHSTSWRPRLTSIDPSTNPWNLCSITWSLPAISSISPDSPDVKSS